MSRMSLIAADSKSQIEQLRHVIFTFRSIYSGFDASRASPSSAKSRSAFTKLDNQPCLFTRLWTLSLSSSSSLSVALIHPLYPFSHKPSARPERCKQPYLQRWKQSEVNNEAGLLCFMCHGEIATWLKSQLGERQWCSSLSLDSSGMSYVVPLVSSLYLGPFTANSLNHVWWPLSCCLSLYRDYKRC